MSAKKKAPMITAISHGAICVGADDADGTDGTDGAGWIVVEEDDGIATPTLGPGDMAEMDMGTGEAASIDIGVPVSTGMTLLVVRRVGGMVSMTAGELVIMDPGDSDVRLLELLSVLVIEPVIELLLVPA